jgi:putative ABC transport system ATP-binding protein
MPALLAAEEVSKIYQMGSNSVTALDNVSLEINEGEFVAIQGTSGSGKSTLLNMLGGLDHPTKGEVYFANRPLGPFTSSRELLARVGLADRFEHKPSELSGGEQQRVAIARALANNPKVLLADEPTGNLDSIRAHELLSLLREMVNDDALTILMVTHDQELANSFAHRIVFMKDGRVV